LSLYAGNRSAAGLGLSSIVERLETLELRAKVV